MHTPAETDRGRTVRARRDDGTRDADPATAGDARLARAYRFADLSRYSLKQRFLIRAADLAFYLLIRLVGRTVRFRVEGWHNFEEAAGGPAPPVYTTWHDRVF